MTNRYFRPILSSNIGNSESPFGNIQSLQNQQGSYLRTEEAAISPFKEDLLPMRTFLTNMELLGLYDHEIPAERLSPFKGPEETRFKRKVYQIKLNILKKAKARFVASLPEKKLDWIKDNRHPTGKPLKLRVEAAESCSRLLKSAREYFLSRSLNVKFYAQSGYRSAEEQLKKWNSNFPKYYSQTENKRKSMEGGPHGDKAAIFLIRFIGGRLAMPGFSLHNSGLAVDFITVENGKKWGIMTTKTGVYENAWRKTYFFDWLSKNASIFKFFQNNKINEPWHWEYRPGTSSGMEVPVAFPVKPLMGETLYVNIDLTTKNYPDKHQLTGIYIPPSFIRGLKAKANVIIYLHGHKTGYPKVTATIREYWESKNFPLFAFREELSESGKNAILIAPTLGPRSQAGKLINVSAGGGLHWYLGQILGILRKRGIANEINFLCIDICCLRLWI
ncbi:MAG TPA: D-alanyl-D-alanine carboxypeptidase family protein [Nitrososphaeraceae archaeon]|nr:D-alanyl-D-alanine carboxypeptidase family protein [Nitrososphaeraceae archaeon]